MKKHLFITQSFETPPHRIERACYVKKQWRINQQIKHYHNKTLFTQSIVGGCKERKRFCWKSRHARMSRSFLSLSLLPPKRLYDLFDVTIHLQQDGNWKCSITGFPSWLIANKLLYTNCCLHFDSTLNGKFCEYSHGRCAFLQIEIKFEFLMIVKFSKLEPTSTPRWERPDGTCCRRWW